MKIKAVIFDLDDTLYDVGYLTEIALKQAVVAMINEGLNCSLDEGMERINRIINEDPNSDKFRSLAKLFDQEDTDIIQAGWNKYMNYDFDEVKAYPDTKEVLNDLSEEYKLVLISQGSADLQNRKIDLLGIRPFFDFILLPEVGKKKDAFDEAFKTLGFKTEEILVVGDRIGVEIKIANDMGMKTIRALKGKYRFVEPQEKNEKPDFEIISLSDIFGILDSFSEVKKKLKIVTIGGGTGTSAILEGLKNHTDNITTIVNVTDSGRSSGIIRKEFDILAPGDIRNCLIALSNSEKLLCDLFQYRFDNGTLNGHSFGNLFIAALSKLTGSFESAVEEASKILKLKGKVLPSTFDNIHICAELEDGSILKEEDAIIDRNNDEVHLRSKIKRVFLNPSAKANEKTLQAIEEADLIVLCPGSLYTSIISPLLVEGISEAINKSEAKKVYICNIMTQLSQTYGYKVSDHVKKILEYLGGSLDFVILNDGNPGNELLDSYAKEDAYLVENDIGEVEDLGIKVVCEDLLDSASEKKLLWEKKNLLRHDPDKIAEILVGLGDS